MFNGQTHFKEVVQRARHYANGSRIMRVSETLPAVHLTPQAIGVHVAIPMEVTFTRLPLYEHSRSVSLRHGLGRCVMTQHDSQSQRLPARGRQWVTV